MNPPTHPPYYPYPVPVVPVRNGLATAALVLGLCTFVTFGASGIPAVVCGILGLRDSRAKGGVGEGMAITGLVFGGLAVFGWISLIGLSMLGSIVGH